MLVMIVMCFSIFKALKADYAETQLLLNKTGHNDGGYGQAPVADVQE
jgi:choline-glycine betaine transporter